MECLQAVFVLNAGPLGYCHEWKCLRGFTVRVLFNQTNKQTKQTNKVLFKTNNKQTNQTHTPSVNDPAQAMDLNALDCTTSGPSLGLPVKGRVGLEELAT